MKKSLYLSVFITLSFYLIGCTNNDYFLGKHINGVGETTTQSREVSTFDEVEIAGNSDVEIYKSNELRVEVSDYSNIVKYTIVKVEGHRLIIKNEPEYINLSNSKSKVIIHTPADLQVLHISGSGDMVLKDVFNSIAKLSISGSGNIIGEKPCNFDHIIATTSGSGDINFKGTANNSTIQISGSGDIDFTGVKSQNAECQISGSGNINLYVTGSLEANISGSGDIEYYGRPIVNSSVSGSGSITHKN